MSGIGLANMLTSNILTASVTDADYVVFLDVTDNYKPKKCTVTNLNAGGILDDDNTWSGTNTFATLYGDNIVYSVEDTASQAEVNAGKIFRAAIAGKTFEPVGLYLKVTGNFSTGTSIDIVDSTTGTIVVSYAQAQLTDGAILLENDTGATLGAGWLAALAAGEGLKIVKVGSDFTGGTSVTVRVLYKIA